jgi:hypothetical protein
MAMPMSALSKGVDDAQLLVGAHPGKQHIRGVQRYAQLALGKTTQLIARDHQGVVSAGQPDLPRDRKRSAGMVTGRHDHADPGVLAFAKCLPDLRPRRIFQTHQFGTHELLLQRFTVPPCLQGPIGERQHPKALLRHCLVGRLEPAAQLRRERAKFSVHQDAIAQRRDRLRRTFAMSVGPSDIAWTVDIRMRSASNGISSTRRCSGGVVTTDSAISINAISMGSPSQTVAPSCAPSLGS